MSDPCRWPTCLNAFEFETLDAFELETLDSFELETQWKVEILRPWVKWSPFPFCDTNFSVVNVAEVFTPVNKSETTSSKELTFVSQPGRLLEQKKLAGDSPL